MSLYTEYIPLSLPVVGRFLVKPELIHRLQRGKYLMRAEAGSRGIWAGGRLLPFPSVKSFC